MRGSPCTVQNFMLPEKQTCAAERTWYPVKGTVDKRRHLIFQASAQKNLSTAAFVAERERVPVQDTMFVLPHYLYFSGEV